MRGGKEFSIWIPNLYTRKKEKYFMSIDTFNVTRFHACDVEYYLCKLDILLRNFHIYKYKNYICLKLSTSP